MIEINYNLLKRIKDLKTELHLEKRSLKKEQDLEELIFDLNIYTELGLLINSEEYDSYINPVMTFPFLKEKKYIRVPTYDGEVSLLQEHTLGHKKYILSKGKPEIKNRFIPRNP